MALAPAEEKEEPQTQHADEEEEQEDDAMDEDEGIPTDTGTPPEVDEDALERVVQRAAAQVENITAADIIAHADEPSEEAIHALRLERRQKVHERRRGNGTEKAYGQWRREWDAWCDAEAGDDVHGLEMPPWKKKWTNYPWPAKASLFLVSYAARRPRRRSNGTIIPGSTMGLSGVKMASKALGSIHSDLQASKDPRIAYAMRNCPRPGEGTDVKDVLSEIRHAMGARFESDYVDRSLARHLTEGYSKEQHLELCEIGVFDSAWKPQRNSVVQATQMHISHVFRHNFSIRADDMRDINLADLYAVRASEKEGPMAKKGDCYYLVIGKHKSKMNKEGRAQLVCALRHATHPEACAWFALAHALWVFYEAIDNCLEPPDFAPTWNVEGKLQRLWYHYHVLPGYTKVGRGKQGELSPTCSLTYETMNRHVKMMFEKIEHKLVERGWHTLHLCKGVSLRDAEEEGSTEPELARQAGHSGKNALCRSYLIGPAYNPIRVAAGFPAEAGHYYLARGLLDPPDSLVDLVYPNLLKHASKVMAPDYEHKADVCGATKQFIMLVRLLARYFLQDVAVMWDDVKDGILGRKAPFTTEAFHAFRLVSFSKPY